MKTTKKLLTSFTLIVLILAGCSDSGKDKPASTVKDVPASANDDKKAEVSNVVLENWEDHGEDEVIQDMLDYLKKVKFPEIKTIQNHSSLNISGTASGDYNASTTIAYTYENGDDIHLSITAFNTDRIHAVGKKEGEEVGQLKDGAPVYYKKSDYGDHEFYFENDGLFYKYFYNVSVENITFEDILPIIESQSNTSTLALDYQKEVPAFVNQYLVYPTKFQSAIPLGFVMFTTNSITFGYTRSEELKMTDLTYTISNNITEEYFVKYTADLEELTLDNGKKAFIQNTDEQVIQLFVEDNDRSYQLNINTNEDLSKFTSKELIEILNSIKMKK
ncbi:hypothetical protein [Fredinandcohnia quinoae]|uniref:DUF4367 domain-containing protein n=1 Tax=Fredinandcohnia quinoae TaxID=2918902 RepID=A0AAW5E0Z1_9BACI|nr:hypothetical protein [Fredinandcohnia sp. SECRCQ15]MCH1624379.1 hypothetical protein [Fredinandcohnia sp. SECRCQ15]